VLFIYRAGQSQLAYSVSSFDITWSIQASNQAFQSTLSLLPAAMLARHASHTPGFTTDTPREKSSPARARSEVTTRTRKEFSAEGAVEEEEVAGALERRSRHQATSLSSVVLKLGRAEETRKVDPLSRRIPEDGLPSLGKADDSGTDELPVRSEEAEAESKIISARIFTNSAKRRATEMRTFCVVSTFLPKVNRLNLSVKYSMLFPSTNTCVNCSDGTPD